MNVIAIRIAPTSIQSTAKTLEDITYALRPSKNSTRQMCQKLVYIKKIVSIVNFTTVKLDLLYYYICIWITG